MLSAYVPQPHGLARIDLSHSLQIPEPALWLDLLEPSPTEEQAVEQALLVDVPTREEMMEIETSNRLYEEGGALYMTVTVAAKLDTDRPESEAVTFILTSNRLVTNRYVDTKPFQRYSAFVQRHLPTGRSAINIFAGLIEAFVERIADVLEVVAEHLDEVSAAIFSKSDGSGASSRDLRALLKDIGLNGELDSRARESLVSLGRLLEFVQQSSLELTHEQRGRFKSLSRDVTALSDHASFLGGKVSLLLEATLGLVNLEQNNIIKIFSVAAVLFLPPTLVASIYGMNFDVMPELHWAFGYPLALLIMVASMVVTYVLFKRKGWL